MKAMAFPAMDDPDALPSSFVTKVLAALGKWESKLANVHDFFASLDPSEQNQNMKMCLNFIKDAANLEIMALLD